MTIEDLKGTKIYLSNKEDVIKFQEKVLKLGVKWSDGSDNIHYIEKRPFYYINNELEMARDSLFCYISFISHKSRQIFLHEVLAIEEPKEECKFKPFDRVLVRDQDGQRWLPREFAWYNPSSNDDYPFETISGLAYRYCIPYDEDLANTTKAPEQ